MTGGVCPFAEQVRGVSAFTLGFAARVGFVDHVAAGYMSTMRRAGFWNEAGVSAHFAVGRDGSIVQLVNLFDTAWHAGALGPEVVWRPYETMRAETGSGNPNAWLVGIEHEGFPGEPWTDAMYATDLRLKRWCIDEAKARRHDLLRFGLDSLAGHFMFDGVNRRSCPGPTWPRERLYAALRGDAPMIRHNAISPRFDRPEVFASDRDVDARREFRLPEDAIAVEAAVYLQSGSGTCLVFDGRGDDGAEHYAFEAPAPYFQARVNLDAHGCFVLRPFPGTTVRLRRLGCVGYYTV